jgi:hypothetical protein
MFHRAGQEPYLGGMHPRQIRGLFERAAEAVAGSLIARTDAFRGREAWRIWRAHWSELERLPPADRLLGVCMYCERYHASTGEWVAAPPALAEMLRDRKVVQLTHGICPICLAGRLDEPLPAADRRPAGDG